MDATAKLCLDAAKTGVAPIVEAEPWKALEDGVVRTHVVQEQRLGSYHLDKIRIGEECELEVQRKPSPESVPLARVEQKAALVLYSVLADDLIVDGRYGVSG